MNVHYTARRAVMTPEIQAYCEKRLEGLQRIIGPLVKAEVILSAQKTSQRAEIRIEARTGALVVVEESADLPSSLNLAFDNLEKKFKKEKAKVRERKRRSGRERKAVVPAPEAAETGVRVVRSPYFSVKPMSVEEALLQFEARDREVLVFRRGGREPWAVLFRRKDGHIGLVEPE